MTPVQISCLVVVHFSDSISNDSYYDTNKNITKFFTSLVVENYNGDLENTIFADIDLLVLKEKERNIFQKKENY